MSKESSNSMKKQNTGNSKRKVTEDERIKNKDKCTKASNPFPSPKANPLDTTKDQDLEPEKADQATEKKDKTKEQVVETSASTPFKASTIQEAGKSNKLRSIQITIPTTP